MSLQRLDAAFAALLALFGALITVYAIRYGVFADGVPGPGFFPLIAGLMIGGLSVVNLLRNLRGAEVLEGGVTFAQLRPVIGITLLLVGFVYAAPYLGILLPLPFVLVAMAYLVEPRRGLAWFLQITAIAMIFSVGSGYLFGTWLGVLFPPGPFGF